MGSPATWAAGWPTRCSTSTLATPARRRVRPHSMLAFAEPYPGVCLLLALAQEKPRTRPASLNARLFAFLCSGLTSFETGL